MPVRFVHPQRLAPPLAPPSEHKPVTRTSGFTLIEVLVVVIMAAALAAIAAPGWFAYMNRQRVNTARTEVLQALRDAQAKAISGRLPHSVKFDLAAAPPSYKLGPTAQVDAARSIDLGQANTTAKELKIELSGLALSTNSISFDLHGAVIMSSTAPPITDPDGAPVFKAIVGIDNGSGSLVNPRRCVIIQTLLGSMREANDEACN